LALEAAWRDRFGSGPAFFPSDDSIAIVLPEPVDGRTILDLVTPDNLESLLRRRLEQSGFFCARFRESAGRALLLTRTKPGQRLPLWMNRLKSQRLLEAVQAYPDFPILLETWRTCLRDEFDLDALRMLLGELEIGQIAWSEVHTPAPSPLAQGIAWRQINRFMYQFDEPPAGSGSRLADDLIREVALSPELRPAVPRHVIEAFEAKRRRLFPGYPPSSAADLVDWVRERWAIPQHEWDLLRTAMVRDLGPDAELVVTEAREKLVFVKEPPLVAMRERLPMLNRTLWEEPGRLEGSEANGTDAEADLGWILGEWLSFYGPVTLGFVARSLGLDPDRLARTAADLVDAGTLVAGPLVDGEAGEWIADTRNFETLLRMSRSLSAPVVQPRPIDDLQAFLAGWQGLGADGEDAEALLDRMGRLMFLPLPAALWEAEVLPARVAGYRPAWLDEVLREGTLAWIGGPGRTIAFGSLDALDLRAGEEPGAAVEPTSGDPADDEDAKQGTDPSDRPEPDLLFPDPEARYDFGVLARGSGLSGSELVKRLWAEVWQGRAANDTFLPIRRGLISGWKTADSEAANGPGGAARFGSRRGRLSLKSPSPLAGSWFRLPAARPPEDLIDAEERKKDRARLLLDRYGVAARELLAREAPGFRWPDLFRTFRLMELSGEVAAGLFYENLAGPQFTEPRTLGLLAGKFADDRVWWLSALDPASLCGLGIEALRRRLPHRREGVRLVYRGRDLALVSERKGKALTIHLAPDAPGLIPCLEVVKSWFARPTGGPARVRVETINDLPAGQSPYLEPIRSVFTVMVEHREVSLYPK
jgi:ATP-dependent Lhr-like helicase